MLSIKYAYLLLDCFFLVFWGALFLRRKDLRNEMWIASISAGILGVCFESFFLRDYWTPILLNGWSVGFEDFLYGFAIGGIASVVYEEFFKLRFRPKKNVRHHWRHLFFLYLLAFIVFFVVRDFWGINTMYAVISAAFVAFFSIMYVCPDLFRESLLSGLLFAVITFLSYLPVILLFPNFIESFWHLQNLSGVFISGIPLEEFLWAFVFGLVAGPYYELWTGRRLKKI